MYKIETFCEDRKAVWDMVKDCYREFLGDDSGVHNDESFYRWFNNVAQCPIFVYYEKRLICCSYLCGLIEGNKAAIHVFTHPDYRTPKHLMPMSRLGMDFYFKAFNLKKLEGVVPEFNRTARLFDLRIGMKKDGIFREEFFYNGKFYDCILFSILRSEFYGK